MTKLWKVEEKKVSEALNSLRNRNITSHQRLRYYRLLVVILVTIALENKRKKVVRVHDNIGKWRRWHFGVSLKKKDWCITPKTTIIIIAISIDFALWSVSCSRDLNRTMICAIRN